MLGGTDLDLKSVVNPKKALFNQQGVCGLYSTASNRCYCIDTSSFKVGYQGSTQTNDGNTQVSVPLTSRPVYHYGKGSTTSREKESSILVFFLSLGKQRPNI